MVIDVETKKFNELEDKKQDFLVEAETEMDKMANPFQNFVGKSDYQAAEKLEKKEGRTNKFFNALDLE